MLLPALTGLAVGAKVGYSEAQTCADRSGMEACYSDAQNDWASCINDNCEGVGVDCHNDQVYSCEYQQKVGDIPDYCLKSGLDNVLFYPTPGNAPGSCSCNLGKLLTSLMTTTSVATDRCDRNGEELAKQPMSRSTPHQRWSRPGSAAAFGP
ncbi:hypothetical protein B0I35DRAFT_483639 [Stachybotrys elegans]|uniref:Extracellular membrane protein CFEM domain-containing protein n=1 Tax=Stachybotrys elegans TaxID=80388 RepID=A0A8K0WKR2_9HYPO|nr:hypothetical protein B0I35DRAFT_483639 [Stachybotrys elegans]